MRKRNCGTSGHQVKVHSLCGSVIGELQVTIYSLCGTSSDTVLIFQVRNYGTSSQVFSCAEVELRNFRSNIFLVRKWNCGTSGQVLSLCGSGIAELQVNYFPCAEVELRNFGSSIFLVRKQSGDLQVKYFPCAEAELRHFRLSMFLVRKRNCGTSGQVFSLCGSRIAELQVRYFPCAEAELRDFRSSIFLVRKRNCGNSGRATGQAGRRSFLGVLPIIRNTFLSCFFFFFFFLISHPQVLRLLFCTITCKEEGRTCGTDSWQQLKKWKSESYVISCIWNGYICWTTLALVQEVKLLPLLETCSCAPSDAQIPYQFLGFFLSY